jgi:hypothetical protein
VRFYTLRNPNNDLDVAAIREMLLHILDESFHRFGDIELTGIDLDLSGFRRSVRRGDACEVRDFAGACTAVQAFGVAALADVERSRHRNLVKLVIAHGGAGAFPVRPKSALEITSDGIKKGAAEAAP